MNFALNPDKMGPRKYDSSNLGKNKRTQWIGFFSSEGRIPRRRRRRRGNVISGLSCFMQISRFHSLKMQMSLMYTNAHTITTLDFYLFCPSFYVIVWKQKIGQNEKYVYGWSMNSRYFTLESRYQYRTTRHPCMIHYRYEINLYVPHYLYAVLITRPSTRTYW